MPGLSFFLFLIRSVSRIRKEAILTLAVVLYYVGWLQDMMAYFAAKFTVWVAGLDFTSFTSVNFSVVPFISYVNAVLPVQEAITLLVLFYAAWLSLILIRWVKSFVPTIAN